MFLVMCSSYRVDHPLEYLSSLNHPIHKKSFGMSQGLAVKCLGQNNEGLRICISGYDLVLEGNHLDLTLTR